MSSLICIFIPLIIKQNIYYLIYFFKNMDSGMTPEIQVRPWLMNNTLQEITNAF